MPCLTSMLHATTLLCVKVVSLWLSSVLLPPTLSVLMPRRCLTHPSIVDAETAALSNNTAAAREDDAARHACWPLGDTRCRQSAGLWTSPPEAPKSFATAQLAPAESARIRPPAAMYPVLCAQAACLGDVCLFLRLMMTCCAARCRVWMQRARAVRQEVEAYANFILATRLWLPGFLAHDVIDVRVSWNAPEWIHAQIRLPTFFDNSFRCADEATMQQWIDQHPRLRGLPPLAALHRMNCLDNMAPNGLKTKEYPAPFRYVRGRPLTCFAGQNHCKPIQRKKPIPPEAMKTHIRS